MAHVSVALPVYLRIPGPSSPAAAGLNSISTSRLAVLHRCTSLAEGYPLFAQRPPSFLPTKTLSAIDLPFPNM